MEVLSRYQVLPVEGPLPWFSGSPMQLHTVQLVLDQLSGRVLLQILAQNMTDQPMKSVCLPHHLPGRCWDSSAGIPRGAAENIYAAPHGTFHNRQNLYLPTGTASCDLLLSEYFSRTARSGTGSTICRANYCRLPRLSTPTHRTPPHCSRLPSGRAITATIITKSITISGIAAVGRPIPLPAMYCGRCCAPRSWLQANARHIPARRPAPGQICKNILAVAPASISRYCQRRPRSSWSATRTPASCSRWRSITA